MRRPQGYATQTVDGKIVEEQDTYTCGHCNSIVFVKPKEDPSKMGGFCTMCMSHTCAKCAGEGSCTPFEKKLEEMERRDRFRKALG